VSPHTVVTGHHALPALAFDFAVILTETEEQILANLTARRLRDPSLELRAQTSTLVQRELLRRGAGHEETHNHCYVVSVNARPWSDAVDRAYEAMSDRWDSSTALGYPW
jgi:hypothetical protein